MMGPSDLDAPTSSDPIQGGDARAPVIDRAAALAEGAPGIPLKFVYWALGVVLVLSLGGLVGEHLFSAAGLNPVATTAPTSVPTTVPAVTPSIPETNQSIGSSLPAFMGLTSPAPRPADPFTLTDQNGQSTPVPAQPPASWF